MPLISEHSYSLSDLAVLLVNYRIRYFENHVSELESESERLSRALESQTALVHTQEQALKKKSEEYAREVQGLVN